MPDTPPTNAAPVRRPWIVPSLTRHESLVAVTQQYYPQEYPPGDPRNPPGMYSDPVSGGENVFI